MKSLSREEAENVQGMKARCVMTPPRGLSRWKLDNANPASGHNKELNN